MVLLSNCANSVILSLEAFTLSEPQITDVSSLSDLIERTVDLKTHLHNLKRSLRSLQNNNNECETFTALVNTYRHFSEINMHAVNGQKLQNLLHVKILASADALMTESATSECHMSSSQAAIAQVFKGKQASSLLSKLFTSSRSNHLYILTVVMLNDMMMVAMHVFAKLIDIRSPSEWNTALTLASLKLDFAVWQDQNDMFAAEFDEMFFPRKEVDSLMKSVLDWRCAQDADGGETLRLSVIGNNNDAAAMKEDERMKHEEICTIVQIEFAGLSDTHSIAGLSEKIGQNIRNVVNRPIIQKLHYWVKKLFAMSVILTFVTVTRRNLWSKKADVRHESVIP